MHEIPRIPTTDPYLENDALLTGRGYGGEDSGGRVSGSTVPKRQHGLRDVEPDASLAEDGAKGFEVRRSGNGLGFRRFVASAGRCSKASEWNGCRWRLVRGNGRLAAVIQKRGAMEERRQSKGEQKRMLVDDLLRLQELDASAHELDPVREREIAVRFYRMGLDHGTEHSKAILAALENIRRVA